MTTQATGKTHAFTCCPRRIAEVHNLSHMIVELSIAEVEAKHRHIHFEENDSRTILCVKLDNDNTAELIGRQLLEEILRAATRLSAE